MGMVNLLDKLLSRWRCSFFDKLRLNLWRRRRLWNRNIFGRRSCCNNCRYLMTRRKEPDNRDQHQKIPGECAR